MKRRGLRAECLVGLAVGAEQRGDGRRYLIGARGQQRGGVGRRGCVGRANG